MDRHKRGLEKKRYSSPASAALAAVRMVIAAIAAAAVLTACGSAAADAGQDGSVEVQAAGASGLSSAEDYDESDSTAGGEASSIHMWSGENAISDLVTYEMQNSEIEDFNLLHSQSSSDFFVTANLVSGLCAADAKGQLIPAIAKSWEHNADSSEWTFHLRDDVTWVNQKGEYQADLTAEDFLCSMEWVLNYWKNESANTSMPTQMIQGAEEYYELTKSMDEEDALALDWTSEAFTSRVGVRAEDPQTLVYTLNGPRPYFDSIAVYACLYPAPCSLVRSMTAEDFRGITWDTMWYCGPYLLDYYVYQNEKVFVPNPSWFGNADHTRFHSVTVKMVDSSDTALAMYRAGEMDEVVLNEAELASIPEESAEYSHLTETRPTKYSTQIHYCYDKNLEDGKPDENWNKVAASEAFRLSWYYGLDLSGYYRRINPIHPEKCEDNCYTMRGLVYLSDGTDYTDLVLEKLGLSGGTSDPADDSSDGSDGSVMRRLDAGRFAAYKKQAMKELSAEGVTFPVEVDYYVNGGPQGAVDAANVLKDCFEDSLGRDYVKFAVRTYHTSFTEEVQKPGLASIYINAWGADYADPGNFLSQECLGDDNAYYSANLSCINHFVNRSGENDSASDGISGTESSAENSGADETAASESAPDLSYRKNLLADYQEYTGKVHAADAIVNDLDARYEAYADAESYLIQHGLVLPCNYNISWQLTKINDFSRSGAMFGIVTDHYYVDWETDADGYTAEDYEKLAGGVD